MPISLGSLDKVDPAVARALRAIAAGMDDLARQVAAPAPSAAPAIAASARGLRTVEQQIQAIGQRVRALEATFASTEASAAAVASTSVVGTPNPPPSDRLPLYDGAAIVAQVFLDHPEFVETSCQSAAGGTWDLMDAIVDALRAVDTRFAYNGKRGNANNPSLDAVAYDYGAVAGGEGATSVYIVDIIAGHCGPSPSAAWQDVTVFAPGVWISRGRF